jgi:MFS family permease
LSYNGYRLVLLLGIISMLGDFVYEGGRSVLPDYMRQLGLDAVAVGSALGFAEFMGWASRPIGGFIADRTGRYDLLVKLGYGGLIVIPLMAFTPWVLPIILLAVTERVLRGLRVPARDAILARRRGEVGLGMAFGIHELLDQVGATLGPLLAIVVLSTLHSIEAVFLAMTIPYVMLLASVTRLPKHVEHAEASHSLKPSRKTLLYSAVVGLNSAGLLPASLVLYMVSLEAGAGSWLVPAAYTLAMVVDAATGLAMGKAFDRWGGVVVTAGIGVSFLPALLVNTPIPLLMLCASLVGVAVGAQETVFRALVAQIAERDGLGSSYAYYGLALGAGAAVAGTVYGYMIESGTPTVFVAAYAAMLQLTAGIMLMGLLKRLTKA